MTTTETHILKFGGTSLKSPAFIERSAQIVINRTKTACPLVVVSAIDGVTDSLIKVANNPEEEGSKLIAKLEQQHYELFCELISPTNGEQLTLQSLFGELRQITQNDSFRKENCGAWSDHILSIGERASALIFSAVLSKRNLPAKPFEAHHFIKTDSSFGQAQVDPQQTRRLVRKHLEGSDAVPVITGFIGSDDQDRITTLGRSGSDYTASLIADALNADHLEIWTDVNGVLTADPCWVPTAESINELSFNDIAELSAHGANVIHPKTISPVYNKTTSILVKNSHNPAHSGTLISSGYPSNGALKTITVTGPFVWLQVDDQHAYPLLTKLKSQLISEFDSEIIAFKRSSGFEPARFLIDQSFYRQILPLIKEWADEQDIDLDEHWDIYKVKKFSNRFTKDEQLTGRIWKLLASKNMQPLSVDRNRNERFVSFLFEHNEAHQAARLLNDYLQEDKVVIDLFIAGTGAVGKTLLQQLRKVKPKGIEFRLLGICNSRNATWNDRGIDLESNFDWAGAQSTNWDSLVDKLTESFRHNLVFVDVTGSSEVARLYPRLFKNGVHIVTPSKLANTFEQSFFDELQAQLASNDVSFRYETTVGAGLPVISTVQGLQNSGDEIHEISGVVSGTMTYLFNQLEKGVSFSEAIIEARKLGYAEPDPRDDLSGEDVARKFLTIARMLGVKIERNELQVESLIPEELLEVDQPTFLTELAKHDSLWKQRLQKAQRNGETLRYTGSLKDGEISIGIQSVPSDSPLGQLKGTDNLIQVFSQFYSSTPLVIQGPGAGKEVTAAGVLNDILKTAKSLS